MQQNAEKLMTKQDIMALAEQLNRIEAMLKAQQQPSKKLVLTNAKEIGDHIGVSEWQARDLMKRPDFPKPITKRTGKYNRGKWKAEEVERFFRVNKGKI